MLKEIKNLISFLNKKGFVKEANFLDLIIKEAGIKDDVFSILKNKFPREIDGKLRSLSENLYKKISKQDSKNILQDVSATIRSVSTLDELINFLRSDKTPLEIIKEKYPENEKEIDIIKKENIALSDIPWILKILNNEESDPLQEIIDVVKYVYNKKSAKKIDEDFLLSNYEKLSDLREYLDEKFSGNKDLYIAKAKSHAIGEDGMEKIYESDKFIALQPKTIRSSIFWSNGTNWCTSTLADNRFRDYNNKDRMLVYVITKDKDLAKEQGKKKKNFSKMSIAFALNKEKNDAYIEEDSFSTVDLNNQNIKKEEAEKYLGDEFDEIFKRSKNFIVENQGAAIVKEDREASKKIIYNYINGLNIENGIENYLKNNLNSKTAFINSDIYKYMEDEIKKEYPEDYEERILDIMMILIKSSKIESYEEVSKLLNMAYREMGNIGARLAEKIIKLCIDEKIYLKFDDINHFLKFVEMYTPKLNEQSEKEFLRYLFSNKDLESAYEVIFYYSSLKFSDEDMFNIFLESYSEKYSGSSIALELIELIQLNRFGLQRSMVEILDNFLAENVFDTDEKIKSFLEEAKVRRRVGAIELVEIFYDWGLNKIYNILKKYVKENEDESEYEEFSFFEEESDSEEQI